MLIISHRDQHESVAALNRASSSFVSCMTTLANTLIGVRPHVPDSSSRARKLQLLATGVYAPGTGVAREIVSLPAPRILRIYNVRTGEPALRANGTTARVVLSLDDAVVESTEHLQIGGVRFELVVRQFIDVQEKSSVSTSIRLQRMSDGCVAPSLVRVDYGIDDSAVNEYLGSSRWLTARYYDIESCRQGDRHFSAIVVTDEHRLRYDVQVEPSPHSGAHTSTWSDVEQGCVISATFDFSMADCRHLFTCWQVRPALEFPCSGQVRAMSEFLDIESEHRALWAAIWKSHFVQIDANQAPVELGVKYAVFQLLQHGTGPQHPERGFISPARGLTSTYHSGATFFDTELHKCIFWIWNDPIMARALIDYRYLHLEDAVRFANATGFSGARFPEASNDRGGENGPRYVLLYPSAEITREWSVDEVLHISANVCYAVHRYWTVTRDDAYMSDRGSEIAMACARFSVSALTWSDSKQAYVVNRVMGPDEYHYHVDNSFYTNYSLSWCIQFALSLIDLGLVREFRADEVAHWRRLASSIYLPWMEADGISIPEEFDGYANLPDTPLRVAKGSGPQFVSELERHSAEKMENFPSKVIKQADVVLLLSLFPQHFSHEVKRAALAFYEPRTVHESSLSYGPHAVLAADVGESSACADFIARASRYNLDFTKVDDYGNGLHLSAYAGAWQGLVEGMAGLRVEGDGLSFRPQLPEQWNSYQFTICFRGRRLHVTVPANGAIQIEHDGNSLPVQWRADGRAHCCGACA